MNIRKPPYRSLFPIRRYLICRKYHCVSRCRPVSTPKYHRQCGRPVTNQAGYDIPDILPNSRTAHGLCFLRQCFTPRQSPDNIIQQVNVKVTLNCQLIALFELCCPDNFPVHRFNSRSASSTSE